MEWCGLIGILTGCLLIAYQDFRSRYIHLSGLILLCVGLLVYGVHAGIQSLLVSSFTNIVFVSFLLLVLHIYFSVRKGRWINLLDRYIGTGDVLLLLVLAPAANLFNYLVIVIAGCICACLYVLFVNFIRQRRIVRIPLAGVMALTFLAMLVACNLYSVSLLNDPVFSIR